MQSAIIHRALAETTNILFPDLAKADPVSFIVASFNYVAGFIAAIVVLVALWGVIKLMSHPGSSSDKSESRGIFWNLLIGVLFFALIYFFFTNILSPDLGNLTLPRLEPLTTPSVIPQDTIADCQKICNPPKTCQLNASTQKYECNDVAAANQFYACSGFTDPNNLNSAIVTYCNTSLAGCNGMFGQGKPCLQSNGGCRVVDKSLCQK